ncbi:MAG TPA: response regulator transcription factor [Acidimicrobiia bacterium]|nr:response regulator transcription factor [Acidimicrobiia bacterium]
MTIPPATIRVVIADDHAIVRGGLEQLLSTADDIALVGTAVDGEEAIAIVAREHPDVVLMDLSMPVVDGVEATRRIVTADPAVRVVVLTSFADDRHISAALQAGAIGYVLKHAGPDELLDAIRAAASGDAPLDPKAARVLLEGRRIGPAGRPLSAREEEVLRLVATGLANKQIARKLSISERTVKAHLTNVFAQLGVSDRTQAALWAQEHLPPDA